MTATQAANALQPAEVLAKADALSPLNADDMHCILALKDADQIDALFQTARRLRRRFFDDTVFFYGFLYTSTWCRNNCAFCYYRRDNRNLSRYRKSQAQTVDAACQLADSGVHLIDLTMGEDPQLFPGGIWNGEPLVQTINAVRKATGLPIMASPGLIPENAFQPLKDAGATWYACYQETHNPELFAKLRRDQPYEQRLNTKRLAHQAGLLTEEGLLNGIGETAQDVVASMQAMADMDADQVRIMTFIPQSNTPMAQTPPVDRLREMLVIALMRLIFPDRLIPASLDVDGRQGLKQRLDAGANVVTSLVPPGTGLAGVARNRMDIEEARRTCQGIAPILADCGLRRASQTRYQQYIDQRLQALETLKS